jgi:DNA-binding transcriptional MerR regulator
MCAHPCTHAFKLIWLIMLAFNVNSYSPKYVPAEIARQHFGVSPQTLRRWHLRGAIRAVRAYATASRLYDLNSFNLPIKHLLLIDRAEGRRGVHPDAEDAFLNHSGPEFNEHWKTRAKREGLAAKAAFPAPRSPLEVALTGL